MRIRRSSVDSVEVLRVVRIISIVGLGTDEEPIQEVVEYWDMDGNLLARRDQYSEARGENPNGPAVI